MKIETTAEPLYVAARPEGASLWLYYYGAFTPSREPGWHQWTRHGSAGWDSCTEDDVPTLYVDAITRMQALYALTGTDQRLDKVWEIDTSPRLLGRANK